MALLLRSALRCRSARPAGRAARLAATAHRPAAVRWLSDDGAAAAEGQHDEDRMEELLELASALSSFENMSANVTQRPDPADTALFLCDLQEKFRPVIHEYAAAVDTSRLMLRACTELGLPVAVTEQYPRGLGHTVSELSEHLLPEHTVVEKVTFSMMCGGENEDPASGAAMDAFIVENDIRKVLICGVETHVCVLQTTLDLLAMGVDVTVIVDGVSSQRPTDRTVALDRLAKAGAVLSTAESSLFQLLGDAKTPHFKAVSKMVQEPRALTAEGGLLGL